MPYVRMSGRWLEKHGFAIGSGVQVVVEPSTFDCATLAAAQALMLTTGRAVSTCKSRGSGATHQARKNERSSGPNPGPTD